MWTGKKGHRSESIVFTKLQIQSWQQLWGWNKYCEGQASAAVPGILPEGDGAVWWGPSTCGQGGRFRSSRGRLAGGQWQEGQWGSLVQVDVQVMCHQSTWAGAPHTRSQSLSSKARHRRWALLLALAIPATGRLPGRRELRQCGWVVFPRERMGGRKGTAFVLRTTLWRVGRTVLRDQRGDEVTRAGQFPER